MLTRRSGHFFFEPNGYDAVNDVTNEYKEAIKVGYNQYRKIVLLFVWGLAPLTLFLFPTLFGLFFPARRPDGLRPPRRRSLARDRTGRWAVSHDPAVRHPGRCDGPDLGLQGAERSVPQCRALLQVAAGPDAWRVDRSIDRRRAVGWRRV